MHIPTKSPVGLGSLCPSSAAPRFAGGAANPYISVTIGDEKRRTAVEPNTLNPVWEEIMVFSETRSCKVRPGCEQRGKRASSSVDDSLRLHVSNEVANNAVGPFVVLMPETMLLKGKTCRLSALGSSSRTRKIAVGTLKLGEWSACAATNPDLIVSAVLPTSCRPVRDAHRSSLIARVHPRCESLVNEAGALGTDDQAP